MRAFKAALGLLKAPKITAHTIILSKNILLHKSYRTLQYIWTCTGQTTQQ